MAKQQLDGASQIVAERIRHFTEEGWSIGHDAIHADQELLKAAICYLRYGSDPKYSKKPPRGWPWDSEWWKPKDHLRNLVRAGALIAAQIDRIQRYGK